MGTVTLVAGQLGNKSYSAAPPVRVSFSVAKANQTINFTPIESVTYVAKKKLALSAKASSKGKVSLTSSNPSVLSIRASSGIMNSKGSVTVTASQAGNANYNAAVPVTKTITLE